MSRLGEVAQAFQEKAIMPLKCDVCGKKVNKGKGFALTTTQVVTDPHYWVSVFQRGLKDLTISGFTIDRRNLRSQGIPYEAIQVMNSIVSTQASTDTPWLVCDSCIGLFNVDLSAARRQAKEFWSKPNVLKTGWTQNTGAAPFQEALGAAQAAYGYVYLTSPIGRMIHRFFDAIDRKVHSKRGS